MYRDRRIAPSCSMPMGMYAEQGRSGSDRKHLPLVLAREGFLKNDGVLVVDALVCILIAGVAAVCSWQALQVEDSVRSAVFEKAEQMDLNYEERMSKMEVCEEICGPQETALPPQTSFLP